MTKGLLLKTFSMLTAVAGKPPGPMTSWPESKDLFTAVTIISCPLRELGATQASAVNPVAQLHVRTADEPQLSTKLADSETIKTMLDVKDWQGDSKLSGRW
ncbi:TPA: hypothetical protein ACH3X2_010438 [Trebouxia sp. C0005]